MPKPDSDLRLYWGRADVCRAFGRPHLAGSRRWRRGASAGSDPTSGLAAQVTGALTVTPEEALYLEVGGNGAKGTPGSHELEAGGFNAGSGGGGASDVRTSPRVAGLSPGVRLRVAGGGGGAGCPAISRADRAAQLANASEPETPYMKARRPTAGGRGTPKAPRLRGLRWASPIRPRSRLAAR